VEQTTSIINNSVGFVPYMVRKVTIRTKTDNATQDNTWNPNRVTFTIEDNGSGIPSEIIDNLLKKFYQIARSVKRKYGGTGLRLVKCKCITEGHGGKI